MSGPTDQEREELWKILKQGMPNSKTGLYDVKSTVDRLLARDAQREVETKQKTKNNFKKHCEPYDRELRVEASLRAISQLPEDAVIGVDYSLLDYGQMVCDELEELLNGTNPLVRRLVNTTI